MKTLIRLTAAAALMLVGPMAQADIISFSLSKEFTGSSSDCSGYYGQGFDNCVIFAEDAKDEGISSIIAKYEEGDGDTGWEVNETTFPDFDVDTIDFGSSDPIGALSGSFTYTGAEGIRFWVAKASTSFTVFYYTEKDGCTDANASTADCMNSAVAIDNNGQIAYGWSTNGRNGLSHISFYDSVVRQVPEPGTLALLGLGLIGIGAARRRKVA